MLEDSVPKIQQGHTKGNGEVWSVLEVLRSANKKKGCYPWVGMDWNRCG